MLSPQISFLLVFATIFVGVVLPAIWSARPERRKDAAAVLEILVRIFRAR